jgi:HAD superfamily hydrolase (TIGR01450 family)
MPIHASPGERTPVSTRRARRLISDSAALLIDWDGCLAFGERLAPGAASFLQKHADHIAIVSNNTTHVPEDFVAFLAKEGVTLARERIILAGPVAVHRAARETRHALVLANGRLRHLAECAGLETDAPEPEAVVLLRDTEFTYERLRRAAHAIHNGARLYVGNPDLTHPDANGTRVPETGALLAALAATVDLSNVAVETVGKPGPTLFRQACAVLGVEPGQALMIGDNPSTDIAGARALEMPALQVGNGSRLSLAMFVEA